MSSTMCVIWLNGTCAAVRVWQGHSDATWAPQCRCGLRARSRVCRLFAMPPTEDAWDIAQLLPRGRRPQDIAADARARARAAQRSPRARRPSRPLSPCTPPLRSPSVDSAADISPTARERVALWGRSIAAHWASGRSGRAPSEAVVGADSRGYPSVASVAEDSGEPAESGAQDCAAAPIESLDEASGDLGHQPRADARVAVRKHLVTEALPQMTSARGDMAGSASCAGSPRVEKAMAPSTTTTTRPSCEPKSPRCRAASESDSDSLMVVTPPPRPVRGRGRGGRGRR